MISNKISHKASTPRKTVRIGSVEADMIRNSVQKSKVQIRERSESPFSMYKSAASTAAQSDSCSQMSDVEEFNFSPKHALPIVMEKGESVFERQNTSDCKPVTEESY